jgi:hypothetical protein
MQRRLLNCLLITYPFPHSSILVCALDAHSSYPTRHRLSTDQASLVALVRIDGKGSLELCSTKTYGVRPSPSSPAHPPVIAARNPCPVIGSTLLSVYTVFSFLLIQSIQLWPRSLDRTNGNSEHKLHYQQRDSVEIFI